MIRTIIVDDEPFLLKYFDKPCSKADSLQIVAYFQDPQEALKYAENEQVDFAILEVYMPEMSGVELAQKLRSIRPDMLIVFVSAYDNYMKEFISVDADYCLLKPYTSEQVLHMEERIKLLSRRQKKEVYIQMFGKFVIYKNGEPIPTLCGKAKEILALVASRAGNEISNKEIYSIVWKGRKYGNEEMKVHYNALRHLKNILKDQNLEYLMFSTSRGRIFNRASVDCDYYEWLSNTYEKGEALPENLLSEYAWGRSVPPVFGVTRSPAEGSERRAEAGR